MVCCTGDRVSTPNKNGQTTHGEEKANHGMLMDGFKIHTQSLKRREL